MESVMKDRLETERTVAGSTGRLDNTTAGQLTHLSDMKDYEIADGEPDIEQGVRAVGRRRISSSR
jgi:hypothetical protein